MNYQSNVENHINNYISKHPYLSHSIDYQHIISKEHSVISSFLERNQKDYLQFQKEIGALHSPYNLKSSQLFCLDLFLPFKSHINTLHTTLDLKDEIASLEFEKVFTDYSHIDVFLKTKQRRTK